MRKYMLLLLSLVLILTTASTGYAASAHSTGADLSAKALFPTEKKFKEQMNAQIDKVKETALIHLDALSKKVLAKEAQKIWEENSVYTRMLSAYDTVLTTSDAIIDAYKPSWDSRNKLITERYGAVIKGFAKPGANLAEYVGQAGLAHLFKERIFLPLYGDEDVANDLSNEFSYMFSTSSLSAAVAYGKFQEKLINYTFEQLNGTLDGIIGSDPNRYYYAMSSLSQVQIVYFRNIKNKASEEKITKDLVSELNKTGTAVAAGGKYALKLSKAAKKLQEQQDKRINNKLKQLEAEKKKAREAAEAARKAEEKAKGSSGGSECGLSNLLQCVYDKVSK